jgi:serine/arginine repetitive matrix protein 2
MMSPTPRGKRGVSVDRAGSALANSSRRNTRLSDVAETIERQGSTGSINYSRPMSGLGHSPPTAAPKATKANGSWFTAPTGTLSEKPLSRPATADGYRSQDARNVQADIAAAANRPTKKKQIAQSTQGSHLAQANNTPLSSFVEPPADPVMVYDPASRTFVARARPTASNQQPPSPTIATPAGPKPGEYDPSTRKIVPAIPSQQPSIVVKAGDSPARRAKPAAVDTRVQPPLRSPARSDTSSSPVSPRPAGILSKQPSMVREDPEGEQEAETITATKLNTKRTNGFSGFSKTTMRSASVTPASPIRTRNRSDSLDVPNSGFQSSGRARGSSYSPSRSAHFSASPIVEFTRHDPPERGVSPAKSAMKHSPGSSLRGTSPMNLGASPASKAMSDTSDTPSVDGSGKKKKKSVRVSFTDQAPNAEPPVTPAFRAAAARKVSPLIDDDMEEIMKPRPDLPSFGSVRPSRVQQEVAEKVTERPPDRREASSDRAIGGVISHDAAKSKSASNPVPPEVTSKNRPSYSSDESEDEVMTASELDAGDATAKAVSSQVVGSLPSPLDLEKKESDVSNIKISLQPPTPGEEHTTFEEAVRAESPPPRSSLEKFVVPGGWAPDADDNVSRTAPATTETSHTNAKSISDTATAAPAGQPGVVASHVPPEIELSDIAESDSDNSAVFSDAEEDLSYMDESGFASMDAIVESPVVKPKKDAGPESPSLRQAARRTSKEEPRAQPDDWSHATSYWKQLSKQQREQIERSHLSSDDEFAPTANSLANRPKKKKSALKQSAPVEPAANTMPAQPARSAMRKSMRGPPEPAPTTTNTVHMRSSLREGGGGGMRTSMRDRPQSEYTASKPAERQNHRPTSSASNLPLAAAGGAMSRRPQSPDEISQDGPFPKMEQRQQQPQTNARLAKKMPPPPAPANDSDSESSFKKKRRPSQSNMDASGRYAMKRSMRAGSFDDSQHQQRPISPLPPATRKAFSVRSLSPTGSFFGRKQLKESMRAPPADSGARTLRGPNSMGAKTGKAQRKPPPAPRQTSSTSNMASKFKSKFADSDDSDDDDRTRGQKPSFFRSRFADSDDDEPSSRAVIPADLTPVRGIPRRRDQQDGDSTDLSDEDDDDPRKASRGRNKQSRPVVPDPSDIEKAMEAARRNLGMTNGTNGSAAPPVNEGSALSKGSLRKAGPERPLSPANEDSPKKRGFMGSILRRSRTYSNTSQKPPMASPPPPLPTNFTPASPRPGKLQRRTSTATQDYFNNNNPKSLPEDGEANWPLSPPGKLGELRPSTSDGVSRHEQAVLLARQMRPDIGRSQSNSEGAIITGGHVGFADESNGMNGKASAYGSKTGKKKKFGMLRRAFGLDD